HGRPLPRPHPLPTRRSSDLLAIAVTRSALIMGPLTTRPRPPKSSRMGCLTYTTAMPRGGVFDVSFLVLSSLAILFGFIAYAKDRSEEHTSELQSRENLVCRL